MKEVSIDELEAASGGGSLWFSGDRDWLRDGCAATVEPGSWCGSNDRCHAFEVSYENRPVRYCSRCSACGFEQWCDNAENLV